MHELLSLILGILTILIYIVVGVASSLLVGLKFKFSERIFGGWVLGLVEVGIVSLFFGMITKSWDIVEIVFWVMGMIGFGVVFWNKNKILAEIRELGEELKLKTNRVYLMTVALIAGWMGWLMANLLVVKDQQLWIAPVHAYGDISLHLSQINSFVYGNNFEILNPLLVGEKISYPFLINWVSAVTVVVSGWSSVVVIEIIGGLLGFGMVVIFLNLLRRLGLDIWVGVLALGLIFFNGGIGFIYFWVEWMGNNFDVKFLFHLPRDYTALKELNYWWINMVLSLFMPQRSFLIGLESVMIILICLRQLWDKFNLKLMILVVILTGSLPIVHAHSLLVVGFLIAIFGALWLYQKKSNGYFLWFGGLVMLMMVMGLAQVFLAQSSQPAATIKWQLGWMKGSENIFWFAFKNFGMYLVAYFGAIVWWVACKKGELFGWLGLLMGAWWILPMLIRFQPWDYDNTKFFAMWYIFSTPLVAVFLIWVVKKIKIIGVMIILLIIFSGGLDMWRLSVGILENNQDIRYVSQSRSAISLGEFIKNSTDPTKTILAIDKFDNPAVALAGRSAVIGYRGWLWTYGIDYGSRLEDLKKMLNGTASKSVFDKYNIGYVIIFDDQTDLLVNNEFFAKKYPLIYNLNHYLVYERRE